MSPACPASPPEVQPTPVTLLLYPTKENLFLFDFEMLTDFRDRCILPITVVLLLSPSA